MKYHKSKGLFWFRTKNQNGMAIKNTEIHELTFSERNQLTEVFHFGKWAVIILNQFN